tara:strand:- start:745 stop:954 length:210 start_codon:yes stop_codon:yes gene_type:complete
MKSWYSNFFRKGNIQIKDVEVVYVEEEDEITDEIEKSLWEIKNNLDLPTEEIEIAITSRQNLKNKVSNE